MWMPRPSQIQTFRASGTKDMGNVRDPRHPIRFSLPDRFVLVYIKGLFTGGRSSADLTIRLAHNDRAGRAKSHPVLGDADGVYDFHEKVFEDMGTGDNAYLDYRVPWEEYPRYTYQKGDWLVPTWGNPNTQQWGLEFALALAEERDA